MKKPKIILVALAPFYEGSVLWVDQLFDFLNVFPAATFFLPKVTLNEKVELEDNMVLSLVTRQYKHIEYYQANANIRDVAAYVKAREEAFEKVKSYFTFVEKRIMLDQFNDRLYWALARQYELLLSEELQSTFHALQQGLLSDLVVKLKKLKTDTDAIVLVSIEHAAIFQEYLEATFETPIFIYGEDLLSEGN